MNTGIYDDVPGRVAPGWHSSHTDDASAKVGADGMARLSIDYPCAIWQSESSTNLSGDAPTRPLQRTWWATNAELQTAHINWLDEIESAPRFLAHWEETGRGQWAALYVVFAVEQRFSQRDVQSVNNLLDSVNIYELTEWSIIALLRSTFFARSALPAWEQVRDHARSKFLAENKNIKKLLMGLLA